MDEIHEVLDPAELASLETEWNALVDAGGTDSIFLSFDWIRGWCTHLAGQRRPFILCVRRHGRLTAILPLVMSATRRRGVALRWLRFAGSGLSDRLGLIAEGDPRPACQALARHLEVRSQQWDRLDLFDLPFDSEPTRCLTQALEERNLATDLRKGDACPFIPIQSDWESYYQAQISAKTRSNNRNKTRRLSKQGELRYRFVRDVEAEPQALEAVFEMDERDAYHGTPRRRPFDSRRGQRFFRDVARAFSRRGWLYLALMELDGKLIAYRLNFRYRGRHCDYFPGFDPAYNRLSPGRLLMTEIIRDCFESGLEEVDFLRGFEDWKSEWTDQSRWNASLCGRNPSLRSKIRSILFAPRDAWGR